MSYGVKCIELLTARHSRRLKCICEITRCPVAVQEHYTDDKPAYFLIFLHGYHSYIFDNTRANYQNDFTSIDQMLYAMNIISDFIKYMVVKTSIVVSQSALSSPQLSSISGGSSLTLPSFASMISFDASMSSISVGDDDDSSCYSTSSGSISEDNPTFTLCKTSKKANKLKLKTSPVSVTTATTATLTPVSSGTNNSTNKSKAVTLSDEEEATKTIPYDAIGWIYGKHGCRIQNIMKKTNTKITLINSSKKSTKLLIQSNSKKNINDAMKLIDNSLKEIM